MNPLLWFVVFILTLVFVALSLVIRTLAFLSRKLWGLCMLLKKDEEKETPVGKEEKIISFEPEEKEERWLRIFSIFLLLFLILFWVLKNYSDLFK